MLNLTTTVAALILLLLGLPMGCSSSPRAISDEPLEFPSARLVDEDGHWTVLVELPNPGWSIRSVETERGEPDRVFVTIARADPSRMYTQQIVPTRRDTNIDAGETAELFARVVDHDWDGEDGGPFHPVR